MIALRVMDDVLSLAKLEFMAKIQSFGLTDSYVLENIEFSANETYAFISSPTGVHKVGRGTLERIMAAKSEKRFREILKEEGEDWQ